MIKENLSPVSSSSPRMLELSKERRWKCNLVMWEGLLAVGSLQIGQVPDLASHKERHDLWKTWTTRMIRKCSEKY